MNSSSTVINNHTSRHKLCGCPLNRPLQPPKKPEAAPFFLPTAPSFAPHPVFVPLEQQQQQQAEQQGLAASPLEGLSTAHEAEAGTGQKGSTLQGDAAAGSHAVKPGGKRGREEAGRGGAGDMTSFVWLLRAGADAGDFSSFMAYARGLSAAALDREVRALQVRRGWGGGWAMGCGCYWRGGHATNVMVLERKREERASRGPALCGRWCDT